MASFRDVVHAYSISSPPSRPQLLASGDASGVIKVWRLSSSLTTQVDGEMDQLASFSMATPTTTAL